MVCPPALPRSTQTRPGRKDWRSCLVFTCNSLDARSPDDNNPTTCDPCGIHSGADDSWGYLGGGGGWEHIACRTLGMTPSEFGTSWHAGMNISRMGVVTTIHMTDLGIEGSLESLKNVYCPFSHLRELDLDGSHFTGGVPSWIADCFPHLSELDLSYGRFSGPLPDWVDRMGSHLNQFKVEHNQFSGTIPASFSRLPALRVLWLHHNQLSGNLPSDLGSTHALISFDARYNPKLCGPIPASLQVDWRWQWEHSAGIIQVRPLARALRPRPASAHLAHAQVLVWLL